MKKNSTKKIVKNHYRDIAQGKKRCCSCKNKNVESSKQISNEIGYSMEDMDSVPEANLGLGCGNPTAIGRISEGDVVVDLGSGAGFDCFLAAKKVGDSGKVIGIDMTEEMIEKARQNAQQYGFTNVEFRFGDIEHLPIEDSSVDVVISNCVINLAPDKLKVFQEAYRALKPNGKMYVSDIVLLEQLREEQRNDPDLIAGCVGGALLKEQYLDIITAAGFQYTILSENKSISKTQYQGIPLESLSVELSK